MVIAKTWMFLFPALNYEFPALQVFPQQLEAIRRKDCPFFLRPHHDLDILKQKEKQTNKQKASVR